MKGSGKFLRVFSVMAMLLLFGFGSAYAATSDPVDIKGLVSTALSNSYAEAYTGSFDSSFLWDIQGIGFDTYDYYGSEDAYFFAESGGSDTLMYQDQNFVPANSLGSWYEDVDLTTAYFKTALYGPGSYEISLGSSFVDIYEVTEAFTYDGYNFLVGDLLIVFENSAGDRCYMDTADLLVLARPTPIPGAVWLLGSGLLGLIGFRRKTLKRG